MCSEALATGQNIIIDMADPKIKIRDIVRRNVSEPAHRVIKRLSGQGCKSKRTTSAKGRGKKQPSRGKKRKKNIKREIFPKRLHSRRRHGSGNIVC
jgi:hypothetical protein